MNATILNRNYLHPTDGWYHIEPKGEHPNSTAKVVQVIDDDACQEIVQRFNQDAEAGRLSHGREMLIDHEHFRHDRDKETIAYGWLQHLENRSDGIYGKIRWSATGQKAVDGGDYRFFSTEYDPSDLQPVAAPGQPPVRNRETSYVRPLRLDGLTLTNDPNNRGGKPITNRQGACAHGPLGKPGQETYDLTAQESPSGRNAVTNQTKNKNRNMKNIATKLGLAEEASEEAILTEVARLQNRLATLEPLAAENTTLKNRLTELDAANVDVLLASHGVKNAKVLNRMKPILLNTPATERQTCLDELLPRGHDGAPEKAGTPPAQPQNKLHNRDTRPPAGGGQNVLDIPVADQAKALRIINRAREMKKETPNLSDATAVLMAQREVEAAN